VEAEEEEEDLRSCTQKQWCLRVTDLHN